MDPVLASPSEQRAQQSANAREHEAGRTPTVTDNAGTPSPTLGFSTGDSSVVANGYDASNAGRTVFEPRSEERAFSTERGSLGPGDELVLEIVYQQPVEAAVIRLIEGTGARTPGNDGGWLENIEWSLLINGQWVVQPGLMPSVIQQPYVVYELIDYALPVPVLASGVRLRADVGGTIGFATISDLDLLAQPVALSRPTFGEVFDLTGEGVVDTDDVRAAAMSAADIDGDGRVTGADPGYIEAFVRWEEPADMAGDRR